MGDCEAVFCTSLGSGSSGNALLIEAGEAALMVDQGFSRKELLNRLETLSFSADHLCGALLTHEHSDHCKGTRVFCDSCRLPLYATSKTALFLQRKEALPKIVRAFEAGAEFQIGPFTVRSFALSHDAVDPVGFRVSVGNVSIGIATDLGHAAENVRASLRDCDALVLESNYDKTMLMNSDRTLELKRRIFGIRGHLGNTDACELLPDLLGEKTRLLLLAHMSRECNDPEIARTLCAETLRAMGKDRVRLEVLTQDHPSERFRIA